MANGESAANFWGNARDVGVVVVSALAFTGSVEYFYYLRSFGVSGNLALDPASILITSVSVLRGNVPEIVAMAVVAIGILALDRVQRFSPITRNRITQLVLVAAAFTIFFFLAKQTGIASGQAVRMGEGRVFLNSISFRRGSASSYPHELRIIPAGMLVTVALETPQSIFLFFQNSQCISERGKSACPRGRLYEINRDDIAAINTSVPDFSVRISK
jgi:hypothetical protein